MTRAACVALAMGALACGGDRPPGGYADGGAGTDAGLAGDGGGATEAELDEVDLRALREVMRAHDASRSFAERIWSEPATGQTYRFHEMPLYLVRRDASGAPLKAFLIGHSAPPPTATPVEHPDLAGLGALHRFDDDMMRMEYEFDFDVTVGGQSSFVFSYSESPEDDFSATQSFWLDFLVHEAFHRYQIVEGAWALDPEAMQDEAHYPLTRENLALAFLENRVLAAGLGSTDRADHEHALRTMVAIRAARIALPEVVVGGRNYVLHYDEPQEHGEGTANYVERVFGELAGRPVDPPLTVWLADDVERPFASLADARDSLAWGRFYATGAALGVLLDSVGTDWKSPAAEARSPIDAARALYPMDDAARAVLLGEAKTAHDYASLSTRADEIQALP